MSISPFLSAYTTSTSSCSPSSTSSPPPPDCTSLLRSLWSDLSDDVMSVSTSITSWLTSITSSSSNTCTTCTSCSPVKQPQRLPIDEWFHWYQHHRHTYIRSLPRASHQRRRGTYLLHDDESDDEDLDNWDEDLVTSQHDQIHQQHVHDEIYEPQTCLCQHTSQHITCRSTTLMVAACTGMYERTSLKHEEFIAPRHLGVAIDDITTAPVSPSSSSSSISSSSSCDVSPAISIPSSPNSARSSSWSSDDDSDVDMTRSSSPECHMRRSDSASSLSMDDEESESECEHMTSEYLDVAIPTKKVDKSALRRRSSSTQHLSFMSRSTSFNRFDPSTSTSPSSLIPKTRRLMTPTSPLPSSSSTDDLMQRLWSIHDGHQLTTMQQSLRDTSIAI